MAIAFDAATLIANTTGATATASHTITGTNPILFVTVYSSAPGTITGVTWGGVALTFLNGISQGSNGRSEIWYLAAPATGTANVVISQSGSTNIGGVAASYTGAAQTNPIDTSSTNSGSSSVTSVSLTTTTSDCWLVGTCWTNRTNSNGTNGTIRASSTSQFSHYDSNGSIVSVGSTTTGVNMSSSSTWAANAAAFKPFYSLTDNLVGSWKLDESSGNAIGDVASYDLTNVNTVGYAAAKVNNGADFGTANTNKALRNTASIGFNGSNNPLSMSFWVKVRTEPGSNVLYTLVNLSGGSNPNNTRAMVRYSDVSGTKQLQFIRQSSSFNQSATYNITLGTSDFYHIVMTYDGTTIKGYVNNVERASGASAGSAGGDSEIGFCIGANPVDTTAQPSSVYVDIAACWTRVITSDEISTLYNGGAGIQYPFSLSSTQPAIFFGSAF